MLSHKPTVGAGLGYGSDMASINKVIIIGNLGADPELRYAGDRAVCNLSVATTDAWKDKASGEKKEKTEWHRVAVWGATAENCAKYLQKGRSVYVEGRLETRSYEKDGVRRYSTDIIADRVQFLGGGKGEPRKPVDEADSAFPPGDDESL